MKEVGVGLGQPGDVTNVTWKLETQRRSYSQWRVQSFLNGEDFILFRWAHKVAGLGVPYYSLDCLKNHSRPNHCRKTALGRRVGQLFWRQL